MRASMLIAVVIIAAAIPAAAQTIAITNGTVYPVSSTPIPNGTVLIRDGVIVAVGARVTIPADARRIDATGKLVTPGLINSVTELGVIEIDQVKDTRDDTAKGTNNISAAFRVWEGLNPASQMFAPTRNEGITTAIITPRGGLISGQAAAIDLISGHAPDIVRRPAVAMVAQVGNANSAGTSARGELIGKLPSRQNNKLITESQQFRKFGGNQHQGDSLTDKVHHQFVNFVLRAHVHAFGRLIEQQHFRIRKQDLGEHDFLLIAAAQRRNRGGDGTGTNS